MISLRYHLVSLAAAFLALAVGVVLGVTTLPAGHSDERAELADRVGTLESERDTLNARVAGLDAFAGAVGPRVVEGVLTDRSVVLVTTHEVAPSVRDGVTALLGRSGATVTGDVRLARSFTDPAESGALQDLVLRLQPAGVSLPVEGEHGDLAGVLLGATLLLDPGTGQPRATSDARAAVLAGLARGGFVASADLPDPAELAVVVTGGADGSEAAIGATTLARFATRLDRSGSGAVLAGPAGEAGATGAIGIARSDPDSTSVLSTVDNVSTEAGRIATVLALREQLDGGAGRYGTADNAEAPAPRP